MGRVLVVSRNPGMALGLAGSDHDVVDIRPAAFDAWVDESRDQHLDGVVLDVTDADSAMRAITELRAHAQMAPVLVVPGDGAGWDDARMRELPAAAVLPLPVTAPGLQEAVDRLVAHGTDSFLLSPLPALTDEPVTDGEAFGESPGPEADAPDGAVEDAAGAVPEDQVGALIERLTAVPSVVHPPFDVHDPVAAPESVAAPRDLARQWDQRSHGARPAVTPPASVGAPAAGRQPIELVRSLLTATDELYGVAETARAIVSDALERSAAQAAAVLLPDGERWRVVAGVGLRPLEHRFELTQHDWLIVEVARGRRSVLMEDTDIVRQPLRGSPLASWHHLLATPIPIVSGVLLVARADDPAFSQDDVESLALLTAEAAPLIESSMDVRELARRLEHLRDHSEPGHSLD